MRAQRLIVVLFLLCVWATAAWADVYCPNCGQRYPDSYNYCPKDGTDLAAARKAAGGAADNGAKELKPEAPAARPDTWEAPPAAAPTPAAPAPAAPAAPAGPKDWASELPIHLPEVYPDANPGDFSLFEWTRAGGEGAVYLRAVLQRGEKGHVSVLVSTLPWTRKAKTQEPPTLREVLDLVGPSNSRREEWHDYRDFARSFEIGGRPLLSPFVGADKAVKISKKDYTVNQGKIGCDVVEYRLKRDGKTVSHTIKTSRLVPFAFVESSYDAPAEKLRLYLFGTLDEDELAPLERQFPAR